MKTRGGLPVPSSLTNLSQRDKVVNPDEDEKVPQIVFRRQRIC